MTMMQDVRCKVGLHRWGPVQGDDRGAHRECSYCGAVKRIHPEQPPDAHDHMGLHS